MDWVEDFCKTLNANPLIAISARKDSKFSCKFLTQIDPQFLKQFQKIEANIDFICGFTKPKDLELGKWNYKESVKSADMFQRNIISFDIDESFKPIGNLSPLPWLVVNSGNGYHLHYKLKEPLGLANDKDRAQYALLYEHLAYKLSSQLGHELDMGAAKPARFMRLPGSLNCKALDIHPIQTFVIEWNETSILDLSPIVKNLVINPLTSPELKGFSDDGFRNEVLRATNWERVFSALGLNYNAKTSGSSVMVLSPFRPEKTASLSLSPGGLWIDFGDTTLKGDLPQFLVKLGTDPDYAHALIHSANILGVPIPSSKLPKQKNLQVVKPSQVANEAMSSVTQPNDSPLALDEVTQKRIEKSAEKEEKPKAKYHDYEAAFDRYFGETKLCIFTGDLMYRHTSEDKWKQAITNEHIAHLTTLMRDSGGFFSATYVKDALVGTYTIQHRNVKRIPEFLIDLPVWDGKDRIKEMVYHLQDPKFTYLAIEELFKHWGAQMFRRVKTPEAIRNPVLILKGPQDIGKDFFIAQMLEGLGSYLVDFVLDRQDKENYDTAASGAVMHVPEFDSLNRIDIALLKQLITRSKARYRAPYQRAASDRNIRCSWIASANTTSFVRDTTGNSRFWIIEFEDINKCYEQGQSPQILAQWQHLADAKYQASAESLRLVKETVDDLTPESTPDKILGVYLEELELWQQGRTDYKDAYTSNEIADVLAKVEQHFKINRGFISDLLRQKGFYKILDGRRLFLTQKRAGFLEEKEDKETLF